MELPSAEALAWIVRTYAELRAAHGEVVGEPDLVLPTGEFFPDEVTATPEGVATLLARTMSYAPLGRGLRVGLEIVSPDDEASGGSCSSGGCGSAGGTNVRSSVHEFEDANGAAYVVRFAAQDGGSPVRLTSSIARGVGALVLCEAGDSYDPGEAESEARAEIAATVCGLGLLVFNGSYIYAKGCGGARVHATTSMDVTEVAAALAIFVRLHGVKPGVVRAHLATTQREAFDLALAWIDGNERIVEKLRNAPEFLVGGAFSFEPPRGLLGRVLASFGGGKRAVRSDAATGELALAVATAPKPRERTEAEKKRLAAAKAMVEDAMSASSSQAHEA